MRDSTKDPFVASKTFQFYLADASTEDIDRFLGRLAFIRRSLQARRKALLEQPVAFDRFRLN